MICILRFQSHHRVLARYTTTGDGPREQQRFLGGRSDEKPDEAAILRAQARTVLEEADRIGRGKMSKRAVSVSVKRELGKEAEGEEAPSSQKRSKGKRRMDEVIVLD